MPKSGGWELAGTPSRIQTNMSADKAHAHAIVVTPHTISRVVVCGKTPSGQFDRLRAKIEADPREPRFIRTVRSAGYLLIRPDAA